MPVEESNLNQELSRDLSVFHLTMMGMGMMIGAGVFLGLGNSIREAGPGGAILTFAINVITPKRAFSAEKFLADHRDRLPLPDDRISVKAVPGADVVETIITEAWAYDLTVIGDSGSSLTRRMLGETIPAQVVERSPKPVILVRAAGGLKGSINRLV